jgi:DnaK suppressor protein
LFVDGHPDTVGIDESWFREHSTDLTSISDNLQKARKRMLELRDELESIVATSQGSADIVELDQSTVGRLSRMDAMQAQAMAKASGQRRDAMLRSITAALKRIDIGDYGTCVDCDAPIAAKRLEFDPTVRRCIDCAGLQESK